jgi:thiol-disulfide isomerase/thioredoxin
MRDFPTIFRLRFVVATALLVGCSVGLHAQVTEASLTKQIAGLRAVPDAQRPATMAKIAIDIRGLLAGVSKVRIADALAVLCTEGDPGHTALQAVADTLAQSLRESPQPAQSDGTPARPYTDLAKLVRYEGIETNIVDPMFARASEILATNDADVMDAVRADFTLMDTSGRKYKLSALKGRIVLVNFWATWCPPCRREMKDLDAIYTSYRARGLIIVSITNEGPEPVMSYLSSVRYRPPVLIDEDGKVTKQFHVDGLPRTFLYDRHGKLAAEAIDMRTRRQFFDMLAHAGLYRARSR